MNDHPASSTRRIDSRWIGAAIAIVFLVIFSMLTKSKPESWNDISRVAAIVYAPMH